MNQLFKQKTVIKLLKYLFSLIFIGLSAFLALNFYTDLSVEELKIKYANTESEFIIINGMPVHYRDEGNPKDSIPLVLIHGTGASLLTWDAWVAKMKPHHRIIRLDLPAYGLTGPNKNHDYSIEFYTTFLNQFLQKIKVKNCYLAGNSLGGLISWQYTLKYPNQVKKLVLIDATGYPMALKNKAFIFKLVQIPVLKDIIKKITPKFIIKKSLLDVYGQPTKVTPQLIEQYHDMARRTGNRAAFISRNNPIFNNNYLKINQISIPTLIMWGNLDRWIKIENAYKFQKDLPNDTLIIYKGIGHLPMAEAAGQSAKDALIFLAKK